MNLMPSILHAAWLPSQQPISNGELFLWARHLDFAAHPQLNNHGTSVGIAEERQRIPSHPHQTQLSQLRRQLADQFPSIAIDRMRPVNATAWFPTSNGAPESRRSVFQQLSAQNGAGQNGTEPNGTEPNGSGQNGYYEDDIHSSHLVENGSTSIEIPSHNESIAASEALTAEQAAAEKTILATWQITGVAISAIDALHFLSQLSNLELPSANADDAGKNYAKNGSAASHPLERLRIGNDLLFFSSVSKFALEILASQHYLPGIRSDANRGFLAVWQPALFDADLVGRFDTLVREMPPVCRAYNLERPAAAPSAAALTENMVASLVMHLQLIFPRLISLSLIPLRAMATAYMSSRSQKITGSSSC